MTRRDANWAGLLAFAVLMVFFVVPLCFMVVVSFYRPDPMAFYEPYLLPRSTMAESIWLTATP